MPVCGCGQNLDGQPFLGGVVAGAGISVNGFFQNPGKTISAHGALAWNEFVPQTLNFTLGNAINASKYRVDGKTVDILYALTFGSTSTYGAAVEWELALPTGLPTPMYSTSDIYELHQMIGDWSALDQSTGLFYEGRAFLGVRAGTAHHIRLRTGDDVVGAGTIDSIRSNDPFTWAQNDELVANIRIETI